MTQPTRSVETRFQPDMVGSKGVTRSNSLFSQSESYSTKIHVLLSQPVGGSSLPSKHFKHNLDQKSRWQNWANPIPPKYMYFCDNLLEGAVCRANILSTIQIRRVDGKIVLIILVLWSSEGAAGAPRFICAPLLYCPSMSPLPSVCSVACVG